MRKIQKSIKQITLKLGIYTSILISVLILAALITTLMYKGATALQVQYLNINNVPDNVNQSQIKELIHKTLTSKKIDSDAMSIFNTQKYILSEKNILVPISINFSSHSTIKKLEEANMITTKWDFAFFLKKDSTDAQEAGIFNSIVGSLFTILICIIFSVPLGIGTAIYLEEFAPKNSITSFIEVNIKNLAAIPSIVYGLLGLILFVNIMEINRSSALVGGLTLSMMATPIIMIITQQALRSVPYSIREGALAMGTSKTQLLFKFLIPISIPTILTGIVLAISRIIGETAPLIIVGMTAFVTKTPTTLFDPTTTLPTQIYLWSDNIDDLFIAKSCLAILSLLFILFVINSIALYLKSKSVNYVK